MKLTLNAEGSISDIRRIIDAIEASGVQTVDLGAGKATDVEAFTQALTWNGKKAVGQLVFVSIKDQQVVPLEDRHLTRDQWREVSGFSEDDFNGVLGSIGRACAKFSDEPNPFVSQGTDSNGHHTHVVQDDTLVYDLFKLLFKPEPVK